MIVKTSRLKSDTAQSMPGQLAHFTEYQTCQLEITTGKVLIYHIFSCISKSPVSPTPIYLLRNATFCENNAETYYRMSEIIILMSIYFAICTTLSIWSSLNLPSVKELTLSQTSPCFYVSAVQVF